MFPMRLDLCGTAVEIGGIGGVSTLPEYRRQHFMQNLMDYAQRTMRERGYPFGWLAGDRRRYHPWGYEISTMTYEFELKNRSPGFEKYKGTLPGALCEGTVDELDWPILWKQAQSNPALASCGEAKLRAKYRRLRQKVLMVAGESGGHVVAHVGDHDINIRAFAGSPPAVAAIVAEKLAGDWPKMVVGLPMYPNPCCGGFKELMSWYKLGYMGSFAVMDLAKTFECFRPHFNLRISTLGLKGKLKIKTGPSRELEAQEVILEADGKELHVRPTDGSSAPTVELTVQQMAEILFSPLCIGWSYRLEPAAKWLAALMPVPVFVPPIYWV